MKLYTKIVALMCIAPLAHAAPLDTTIALKTARTAAIAALGAAAFEGARLGYTKASQWIFNYQQDSSAHRQIAHAKIRDSVVYVVTVNLKNKNEPLTIHESTRRQTHTLDSKMQDVAVSLEAPQRLQVLNKLGRSTEPFAIMGKTVAKNPEYLVGAAGVGTLGYLIGKPSLKTSAALLGVAGFSAWSFAKRYIKEKRYSYENSLISTALTAILRDARKNKNKHLQYTLQFDFSPTALTPCTVKRLGTLVLTHENLNKEIIVKHI